MKKLLLASLAAGVLLAGCSEEKSNEKFEKEEQELSKATKKYDLVFAELIADGDKDTATYQIAYKDGDKVKYLVKDGDHYHERILKDPEAKPYMVRKPDKEKEVFVYRQPYMIYGQDESFEADVKDKSVVK
ncbi:hypothetical protein [Macrococcus brunensis]|uniref:hypothetical protein n=1 Tax=Macrococcus brunensis TaxID=198483 RepID=UPI001EF05073|nr:hypothetical protein [Macrococcus brunensis]ULG72402.1 hypothetical protein MGG12_02460 [Macrococcus brunensis]